MFCIKSPVVKRSIVLAGHKTSVSLEDEFWKGLKEIAGMRLMNLSTLVDTIDAQRQQGNLFRRRCGSSCWRTTGAKSPKLKVARGYENCWIIANPYLHS